MRVLQVNKFYYPHVGGVEKVVQQLSEQLITVPGIEVRVLACHESRRTLRQVVRGVDTTYAASLKTVLGMPVSPAFFREFRSAARQADLIHFHMPFPLAAWCWPLIPRRAKVVVLYHSDIVRQKKIAFLYHPPLKRLLRRADAITASSPPMRQNSPILSEFREKTHVVPFMTDRLAPRNADLEAEIRRRHGLKPGDAVALYVGRLVYYKGVTTLLEAWRGVNAKLLMVGDGPMLGEIQDTIARLGLSDRVILAGRAPDEDLPHYYRVADLFVLPSIEVSEAYALVQMDALAAGLPVVNTNLPTGVPWVSRDGESGITVPPKDADALRDAVVRLLTDTDLRLRMSEGALKRARDFTPEHVLAETLSVYRKVGAEI